MIQFLRRFTTRCSRPFMPSQTNLVVLTIDGLAARDLGAYGNTWIETPGLDWLTSRSWIAENMMICQPEVGSSLESMVTGRPPWRDQNGSILQEFGACGMGCLLFSDQDLQVLTPHFSQRFDEVLFADIPVPGTPAGSLEQTHFAVFLAQLINCQQTIPDGYLLWAHYGGLGKCWDAPAAWREELELDDVVDPPTWVQPPAAVCDADVDPDQRLADQWAWASQVMVIDRCIEIYVRELVAVGNTGLVLTSPRGFPLGEHGVVGFSTPTVYSESSMVPCIAFDGRSMLGWREPTCLQTSFVHRLLKNWLDSAAFVDTTVAAGWGTSLCRTGNQTAFRTPDWMLVRRGLTDELYAKADDRWEVNDVSRRCPDVVDDLSRAVDAVLEID